MIEGKDLQGYSWIRDSRDDEYYYLKDFEHLVVMKVAGLSRIFAKRALGGYRLRG